MLILYYKKLACNRKNDLWLNESPALNFLKDFKIMSHEWQGGVGQKKKKNGEGRGGTRSKGL